MRVEPTKWSQAMIASALQRQTLQRRALVLVDDCNWTGYECDLLCVTQDLRIIDIEVKISRADFRADREKDKWWRHGFGSYNAEGKYVKPPAIHRPWPHKVWKHYYAMPAAIWKPEMRDEAGSPNSGILLLRCQDNGTIVVSCERRATPNKDANKITASDALDIARLANLRMWDAYRLVERMEMTESESATG